MTGISEIPVIYEDHSSIINYSCESIVVIVHISELELCSTSFYFKLGRVQNQKCAVRYIISVDTSGRSANLEDWVVQKFENQSDGIQDFIDSIEEPEVRQLRTFLKQCKKQKGAICSQLHALDFHVQPLDFVRQALQQSLELCREHIAKTEKQTWEPDRPSDIIRLVNCYTNVYDEMENAIRWLWSPCVTRCSASFLPRLPPEFPLIGNIT